MSDSFADLWNSSTPQKPQQSLSFLAAQQQPQRKPQGPDLFAVLASSSAAPVQRPPQPPPSQKPQKPQKQPQQDAFSDLFSSSSRSSNQNLTIAQRAALVDKQRQGSPQVHVEKDSSTWAGLDSLGTGFGGLTPTPIASSSNTSLGDKSKTSQPSSQNKTKLLSPDDDWGLGDFAAPQKDSSSRGSSIWDLDEFASQPTTLTDTSPKQHPESRVDSPSNDFDFGNHEDGLLNETQGHGDEDFMSVFNNPPQSKQPALPPRPTNHRSTASPSSLPRSNSRNNTSPPPHILGQIVEMGFPIPQARTALAANNNDVQAALNQLLGSEGGHSSNGRGTPNSQPRGSPVPASSAIISSQQQPALPRRRDREILWEREQQVDAPSSVSTGAGVQAQAEQLLAQATVMGRGMFSKASSFLKEKSAQVQKVAEEYRSSSAAGDSAGGVSGRPRWAQGTGVDERGFRDSDKPLSGFKGSEPEPEVRIPRRVDRQRAREWVKEPVTAPIQEPEIDLFDPSEPTTSVPQLFDVQASATPPLPTRPRQRQQRRPSPTSQPPPPKFQRNTTVIPHTITSLKSEANAAFKLGQFADAENLYTRAIDSLRKSSNNDNSIYYVLLLNNRANARMKIGDVNGAVKDCEGVVGVVTMNRLKLPDDEFDALGGGSAKSSTMDDVKIDWEPGCDTAFGKIQVPISSGSSELVDLGEGLVKAIKRRADAYEGMEKWGQARKDWEWLRGTSWVRDNMRGEAGRGVERCIRMVGGAANGSSTANGFSPSSFSSRKSPPSTKRKPAPKPIPSRNTKSSDALQNLRSTTAQAEAEDQAKHELKDSVDSKLSAWKSSKETNIRALLASLDLVLWEELLNSGGSSVKVGMHEVVTPAQVKIKYMKAVARVHPDKLTANNSTVEQRMIAQGVFGALNEAWNAFKQ